MFVEFEKFCFSLTCTENFEGMLHVDMTCTCLNNSGSFQFCAFDVYDCVEKSMRRPNCLSTSVQMRNGTSIGTMYVLKH